MRSIRPIVLLCLALLLAACGEADQGTDQEAASQEEPTEDEDTGDAGSDGDEDQDADSSASDGWTPERDVTMTVAHAAGGGTDRMARAIAEGLQQVRPELTIVVENRPGASGMIGYTHAAGQAGDPHHLVAVEPNVMNVPLIEDTVFDWGDFTHIGQISEYFALMTVQPDRFDSVHDLIETAREEDLTVGLAGLAGPLAIATKLIELEEDVSFDRVVLEGGNEITLAVLAGDIDFGMPAPGNVVDYLESGELAGLAVLGAERLDFGPLQDVPTAVEQGIDVSASGFRGLFAAPDIPDEARQYWVDAFEEWTQTDHYQEYNEETLSLPTPRTGDEFTQALEQLEDEVRPAVEAIAEEQ